MPDLSDARAGPRCLAERCRQRRDLDQAICCHCYTVLARMCRAKQRTDGYTARQRGQKSGRGWYQCLACHQFHQTHARSGPPAYAARARAGRAIAALVKHHGEAWFAVLVASWDPTSRGTDVSPSQHRPADDAGQSRHQPM
jgi:hypothetical protein